MIVRVLGLPFVPQERLPLALSVDEAEHRVAAAQRLVRARKALEDGANL
jgi:hypothetical protein